MVCNKGFGFDGRDGFTGSAASGHGFLRMSHDMNNEPALQLTSGELEHYDEHGFVVRQGVFEPQECEVFRSAAQRVESKMLRLTDGAEDSNRCTDYCLDGNRFVDVEHVTVQFEHGAHARQLRVVEPVNDVEPAFDRLIDDARLCEPMKQLVPSDRLGLWTAKLNFKHPRVGSGFGWHQDAPYWIHDSDHVEKLPNVMVMFDDAARSNGCLRVIAGSHRAGCLPGCDDDRQLAGFYTHPDTFDQDAQVLIECTAGSVVFFDPHIVHGSGVNASGLPRRAIIVTYQPDGFAALKSGAIRPVGD